MALRFFADHCVSNQIIDALREAGHEVVRRGVRAVGFRGIRPATPPPGLH
jgi:DNA-directed RNA polymerase specialized sigma subunit